MGPGEVTHATPALLTHVIYRLSFGQPDAVYAQYMAPATPKRGRRLYIALWQASRDTCHGSL
jgi:hypothetical protein